MTKIALVKHNGSQTPYAFYTDIELNKNDLVVCDTQKGYETGRVIKVANSVQGVKPTRWIVSKVDTKNHVERVEKEKRISELTQQINLRKIELNSLTSQHNKAISILIKELDELTNKNNTKKEIELKDSFYFRTENKRVYIAIKQDDLYRIEGLDTNYIAFYNIEEVEVCISEGWWTILSKKMESK